MDITRASFVRLGTEQAEGLSGGIEHALNMLRDYYESEGDLDIDDAIEFLEELLEETALKEELLYNSSY